MLNWSSSNSSLSTYNVVNFERLPQLTHNRCIDIVHNLAPKMVPGCAGSSGHQPPDDEAIVIIVIR